MSIISAKAETVKPTSDGPRLYSPDEIPPVVSADVKRSGKPRLERTVFTTSREMDFFSEKELVTQTGHGVDEFALVVGKELIDNALDACEEADIAPVLSVTADACGITVADNGPGLPEATLRGALDFRVRVSNREAYVSPCRGAQGNALKTLVPMAYVLDPKDGQFIVTTRGRRHVITCGVDRVSNRPVIHDDVDENVKSDASAGDEKPRFISGTEVRLQWGPREKGAKVVWPFDDSPLLDSDLPAQFRSLVEGFAVLNPHLTLTLDWFGHKTVWQATDPAWVKWKPCWPTCPHWYGLPHLERLSGAYITHGLDWLVSDFLAQFHGLSGSQKRAKVLNDAGLKRAKLSSLVRDGDFDHECVARLLAAMQRHTRPVKSPALGFIGEEHLRTRLLAMGVEPDSFTYSRKLKKVKTDASVADEKPRFLPWVLECAFGYLGKDARNRRRTFLGANWSAAIKNPFRSFGSTGEGLEGALADLHLGAWEPVVYVLHLAHPRVEYVDRGKSALLIARGGVA
jgi:DNA topoisomerase VI subunit B